MEARFLVSEISAVGVRIVPADPENGHHDADARYDQNRVGYSQYRMDRYHEAAHFVLWIGPAVQIQSV